MRQRLLSARPVHRLGTGAAYAANTVFSTDIVNGEVKSVDIATGQVQSVDVRNDGLTGADIADQSGVDTCAVSVRIGALCFRAENFERTWLNAMAHCANLDMRAPTLGEAFELAQTHDLPNVDTAEQFWTSDRDLWSQLGGSVQIDAYTMDDAGDFGFQDTTDDPAETVCVTTPTN